MIHTLRGLGSEHEKIQIEEIEDEQRVVITCIDGDTEQSVELDLDKLHSLIGVLLHVQAKLKNRR
tara:strand:+ start:108 stop:302 length:195 start_codon:yes stop_codon:yes gene_type:complete